jgi:hypothetical protein
MVNRSYFNIDEKEATEKELHEVAFTAISILSIFGVVLILLTIYFIA